MFNVHAEEPPIPPECTPNLLAFAPAEGRPVVASFDGGAITSDAGALLLGATDRVLGLPRRLAACFKDSRDPAAPYGIHKSATRLMPSSMSWRRTRPLTRTIGPGLAPYPLHPPSRAQIQVVWASEPDG